MRELVGSKALFGDKYSNDIDYAEYKIGDRNYVRQTSCNGIDTFEYQFEDGDALLDYLAKTPDTMLIGCLTEIPCRQTYNIDILDDRVTGLMNRYKQHYDIVSKVDKSQGKYLWKYIYYKGLIEALTYKNTYRRND
jgi:hypothetical protein